MTGFSIRIGIFIGIYAICFAAPTRAAETQSPPNDIPAQKTTSDTAISPEQVPEKTDSATADQEQSTDVTLDNIVDTSHKVISENIIDLSRNVDAFFSNERYLEESFGSYGCLKLSTFFSEGGKNETSFDVCLKIDLPHTKKRWKLLFESEEVENADDVLESDAPSLTGVEQEQDKSSTALLRYVAEEELLKYVSFDIGVKTRTPLDPFTRLRYRRTWVPDPWLFRLTESLYYFKSTEGGFLSRFDAERRFGKKWYARMTSEADYRDTEQEFNLKQNFGFYRRVGKGRALSWELTFVGASQPNPHVDYYIFRFRYRINVWRDWFFFEVSPQLLQERENDFDSVAGILFSAQAVFGNYYR